jgi:hypothetical protein
MNRPSWGTPSDSPSASGAAAPSACPACRATTISTAAKSPDQTSYWRCSACGEIWNAGRRDGEHGGSSGGWRTLR